MNKYEILGVVGEGAYGVVLKCKNKETNEISMDFTLKEQINIYIHNKKWGIKIINIDIIIIKKNEKEYK